ncbi:MAG: twin-arginine translocase TatA/TatE family subunit [Gemmatimonadota bacterium]
MPNLGFSEIMILLVVALLVFGAKRLPEIGSSMGKGIREFKRSISDTQDAVLNQPDNERNPPRMLDADRETPASGAPSSGEPKRLSQ